MSDFDKFIADKLEEEGDFPNRDRNWRQLSQRLQAFEIGGSTRPSFRYYWPAAAAVVVSLSVAGWLLWKMQAVQQENAALRQEIAALRQSVAPAAPMATRPLENAPAPAFSDKNAPQPGREPGLTTSPASTGSSARPSVAGVAGGTPRFPTRKPQSNGFDQWAAQPEAVRHPVVDARLIPAAAKDSSNVQAPGPDPAVAVGPATQTTLPTERPTPVTPDSAQLKIAAPAADSTRMAQAVQVPPVASPDSTATTVAPPPIVQPLRRHARFRLGVGAVAGVSLPHEPGVSSLLGSGVVAAYAPWRFLQVTASADWLHFDVNTSQYVPRFHAPDHSAPTHVHSHDDLVQVESQQRQQHYSLGLTYALPVRGWLRPVVRVAHTWVHVAPGLVSFKFEESHGGGPGPGPGPGPGHRDPDYIVQKFDGQTINNVWRFGAGLEYELPRWTLGLGADYSKDLGAGGRTFDALLVRGGVQYKFH